MKKTFIYTRVSHKIQAQEGLSLEAQMTRIRAYCDIYGLEIAGEYTDAGVSGRKIDRPAFNEMMTNLEEGMAVVVLKLDRAFRNTMDAIEVAQKFEKMGVDFHSVSEKIDTSSAMGKFFYTLMASIAELESNKISERINFVFDDRRAQGKRVGARIPYGYQLAEDGETLEEHKHELDALNYIKANYGQGMSADQLATNLAKQGHLNRDGRQFTRHNVRNIFMKNKERMEKMK